MRGGEGMTLSLLFWVLVYFECTRWAPGSCVKKVCFGILFQKKVHHLPKFCISRFVSPSWGGWLVFRLLMFDFLEAADCPEQWLVIGIQFKVVCVCELLGTFKVEHNLTVKFMGKDSPGMLASGKYSNPALPNASELPHSKVSCSWGLIPRGTRGETRHAILREGVDPLPVLHKPTAPPTVVHHYWSWLSFQPQELRKSVATQDEPLTL